MKKLLGILLVFIMIGCKSKEPQSTEKLDVLFIGNSLTYFYDMPQTLQLMLNETHPNITIEQITFPGMSLTSHLGNVVESSSENGANSRPKKKGEFTATEKKITEKKWDVIILQEGTVRLLIPEVREYKVETAISNIKALVTNPNCTFILFKTWPSKKEYPKEYCYPKTLIDSALENEQYCSPIIENLEQEMKLIDESFDVVAKNNDLSLSNNGNTYFKVLTEHPEIELYDDEIHPNSYGSFLNACIFYQMLTGNNASEIEYNGELEPKKATLLKKIAS